MKLNVNEIFLSWQGEGSHSGMPAVFVRLSGCNLQCSWCDTDHEEFDEMTVLEIYECMKNEVVDTKVKTVVLTGGEPLLQDICGLVYKLKAWGWEIHLETNGTLYRECLKDFDYIVCSPKRGQIVHNWFLKHADEWKLVITENGQLKDFTYGKHGVLSLQPCDYSDVDKNRKILRKVKKMSLSEGVKISVQLHKFLGLR